MPSIVGPALPSGFGLQSMPRDIIECILDQLVNMPEETPVPPRYAAKWRAFQEALRHALEPSYEFSGEIEEPQLIRGRRGSLGCIRFAHVCRWLRRTTLSSQFFWARMIGSLPDALDEMLELAGPTCPLRVFCNMATYRWGGALVRRSLLDGDGFVRRINDLVYVDTVRNRDPAWLCDLDMPLKSLYVYANFSEEAPDNDRDFNYPIESVQSVNCSFGTTGTRYLRIAQDIPQHHFLPWIPDIPDILRVLRANCDVLQDLTLDFSMSPDEEIPPIDRIRCPSLRTLVVSMPETEYITAQLRNIMPYVAYPPDCSVAVSVQLHRPDVFTTDTLQLFFDSGTPAPDTCTVKVVHDNSPRYMDITLKGQDGTSTLSFALRYYCDIPLESVSADVMVALSLVNCDTLKLQYDRAVLPPALTRNLPARSASFVTGASSSEVAYVRI